MEDSDDKLKVSEVLDCLEILGSEASRKRQELPGFFPAAAAVISEYHPVPKDSSWLEFGKAAFLIVGSVFMASGIIFFFAYNWDGLHRLAKIGIAGFFLALSAGLAVFFNGRKIERLAFTGLACLLTGALLAVFGQAYHIEADAWTLFASWLGLILPIVIAGGSDILWLAPVALFNLAGYLFIGPHFGWLDSGPSAVMAMINLAPWLAIELLSRKGLYPKARHWFSMTGFVLSVVWMVMLLSAILWNSREIDTEAILPICAAAIAYAGMNVYSFVRKTDFPIPALSIVAILILLSEFLIRNSKDGNTLILVSFLIAGMTAGALILIRLLRELWLRKESHEA